MISVPEAPINLTEDIILRTQTSLGLSWSDGLDDGSLPVIDYKITVTSESGDYQVIAEELLTAEYTAQSLTLGETYLFLVQSRNSYGYSPTSAQFSLLCAIKPSAPVSIQTENSGSDAIISWVPGSDNGSPITAYRIYFKTNVNTYVEETINCDGSDTTIVST